MPHRYRSLLSAAIVLAITAISILPAHAVRRFRPRVDYRVYSSAFDVIAVDVNNDGIPDLVAATPPYISVLLGNGDGTFQPYVAYPAGPQPMVLAASDLNNDGNVDLVTMYTDNNVYGHGSVNVLMGNGDGTFQPATEYALPLAVAEAVVIADFNHDGKLDLAATCADYYTKGRLTVFFGNGDGTFKQGHSFDTEDRDTGSGLTAVDLNRDGNLDLVMAWEEGLQSMLGTGQGSFLPPQRFLGSYQFSEPSIGVGDFNSDGRWDVAVASNQNWLVEVMLGDGQGGFTDAGPTPPTPGWDWKLQVADFNGDGKDDLVVLSAGASYELDLLLGNGDGTFQPGATFPASTALALRAADVNNDGAPDLILARSDEKALSVYLNNGGTQLGLTSSANPSTWGDPVTFTATVTPSFSDVGQPRGGIIFKDGTTILAKVPLAGGSASFTTNELAQGAHSITATYAGDEHFNRHESSVLTQTVQ
jgi:hypothetical protein